MLGSGFREESIDRALDLGVRMIGCDAGTTDFGPHLLATGKSQFSRAAVKRDTSVMLAGAARAGIPLVIGSAGGAGGDENLAWMRDLVVEIAREQGLHFRMALIHAEQSKAAVRELMREDRVQALAPSAPLTDAEVEGSLHIVAMMGAEPIQAALDGAQVVLAGRSSDAAIYSALPLTLGYGPAVCWHAGKILECGAAAAYPRHGSDCLLGVIEEDAFTVEPPNPDKVCTVASVAAHSLYERANPYELHLPHGHIDLKSTRFEASGDRAVRVSGTRFVPAATPTLKLEGVARVGFRTLAIAGVREPQLIANLDAYLANVRTRVADTYPDGYRLMFHVYGRDGVMGPLEPVRGSRPHEIGLIIEVIADDAETSAAVLALARSVALHVTYPGRQAIAGNLAFPFSPSDLRAGEAYEFTIHHLVAVEDPGALFRVEMLAG